MRIGLTGGIGSGKSTVAALLVQQGAVLIDTDAIARALTGPGGAAMPALRARFGDAIADAQGALDRERMRALAFADPAAKRALEAVLHPVIGAEAERQAVQAAGAPLVFDVPLLVESGHWRTKVDRVLLVDCSEDTQIERVMQRSGWPREAVQRVIASQASRSARRAAADAVIDNDALTLQQLAAQVDTLWRAWRV
ncbi:MAG TPA: dephospho-CoA kinase [Burkholderiaceae bacterium]|nr:dephospho-CoA kinase [Burkholderiaceae bacterium]